VTVATGAGQAEGCKGCSASVRLAPGEVERLLAEYLAKRPGALVDDATYDRRLGCCLTCPDLRYGTTCRQCGCLVAVRARLADKACPSAAARWAAVAPAGRSDAVPL
jgi:hypothetical protein